MFSDVSEMLLRSSVARKVLSTPGAEPEPFSLQFDLDVSEARAFKAQFERTGIYGDQRVAEVNQP